ncbi:putative JmjC domain protein [Aspergillus lucknowensis]|uniref:JmjC domain-containing protein n=1 Tax=Aspergillus lucknowensis TaxID=176173 RepID=A0ABR4LEW1_9EURO
MKAQKCLLHSSPRAQPQPQPRWLSAALPRSSSPVHPRRRPRRHYGSHSTPRYKPLEVLDDASIPAFRERCFIPERPMILPRQSFRDIPAYDRWFYRSPTEPNIARLDTEYLAQHGADALVPLELTQAQAAESKDSGTEESQDTDTDTETETFRTFHAPLSLFLQWIREAEAEAEPAQKQTQSVRLYLAQCHALDLPRHLRTDLPTPSVVADAGRGDVYDTNLWIGFPPTYTPLHRDPNPNLFVQLAGRKVVRLLAPWEGMRVFARVRGELGRSGGPEAAAFRGEEMMRGRERALLEGVVWGGGMDVNSGEEGAEGFEAELGAGDGVFIPRGWWHSIKGVGQSVTASVNWWFR